MENLGKDIADSIATRISRASGGSHDQLVENAESMLSKKGELRTRFAMTFEENLPDRIGKVVLDSLEQELKQMKYEDLRLDVLEKMLPQSCDEPTQQAARTLVIKERNVRDSVSDDIKRFLDFVRSPRVQTASDPVDVIEAYMHDEVNCVPAFVRKAIVRKFRGELLRGRLLGCDADYDTRWCSKEKTDELYVAVLRACREEVLYAFIRYDRYISVRDIPIALGEFLHTCWQGDVHEFCNAFDDQFDDDAYDRTLLSWLTGAHTFGLQQSDKFVGVVLGYILTRETPGDIFHKAMELHRQRREDMPQETLEVLLPGILKDVYEPKYWTLELAALMRNTAWKTDAMRAAVQRHVPVVKFPKRRISTLDTLDDVIDRVTTRSAKKKCE